MAVCTDEERTHPLGAVSISGGYKGRAIGGSPPRALP